MNREVRHAARVLVSDVRPVKEGDQVLITADDQAGQLVGQAVANEVEALGALPTLLTYPAVQAMAEPPQSVARVAEGAQHWINFSVGYHLYSNAYDLALSQGCVYLELTGMDEDMMIRTVGRVDNDLLTQVRDVLYKKSQAADSLRLTSPAGCDLTMTIDKAGDPFWESSATDIGYGQMLGGQSGVMIIRESVNGVMVFDGATWPPDELGLLDNPISMTVRDGYIAEFDGGPEADIYQRWLADADHQDAMIFDHFCYGFNPGVQHPTGKILEDERVFGCVQIGVGAPAYGSPVHSDGVVLRPSVWLDDTQLQSDGQYVDPDVAPLTDRLLASRGSY